VHETFLSRDRDEVEMGRREFETETLAETYGENHQAQKCGSVSQIVF